MNSFAAILIDFDDTLADTEHFKKEALDIFLSQNGISEFTREPGQSSAQIITDMIGDNSSNLIEEFNIFQADYIADHMSETDILFPDTRDFLAYLVENNLPYNIVTTSTRRLLSLVVKRTGLSKFINPENAVTKDDVPGKTKPAPDPYLLAAKKLNVSARDCLAIEDSKTGIRSALSAGCKTVVINRHQKYFPVGFLDETLAEVTTLDGIIPHL